VPGLRVLVVGLLLAAPSLVACSDETPADAPPGTATAAGHAPPDVVRALTRALSRRAEAVRRTDDVAFEAGLAGGRPEFRTEQRTWFDNLAQLPLGVFRYSLDPATLTREGDDYWVVVDVQLQLDGYDAVPVVTPDRYLFSAAPGHPARFLLASTSDPDWEAAHHVDPQPWDAGPIAVRSGAGVLGIFDDTSVGAAEGVVATVERGLADVSAAVPYPWSRTVVVYALSNAAFLSAIDDLPGDHPGNLDGVAFPVRATPDGDRIAATRFVLNPRMLDRPGPERDRLVRHELTHVALGERDDHVPVWLSEGLAEYVSVRPLAPEDRMIAPEAVQQAATGVDTLPADETFNDDASSVHYALAWWACEYLADGFGEPTLWSLLDAMGEPDAEPEQVLVEHVGLSGAQLAVRASELILATYRPAPSREPGSPSASPSS
jgi:hypothetical protein